MVQDIINRMPVAVPGGMPDDHSAPIWTGILRDPPFIQFAQTSAVRDGESTESTGGNRLTDTAVVAPTTSGKDRSPDARTSPPDINHQHGECGERTLDDMETTCIDYSPQQTQSLDIK